MEGGVVGLGLGLEIVTELSLGIPGSVASDKGDKKRVFSDIASGDGASQHDDDHTKAAAPVAKGQIVGWPPVCSYRKKNSFSERSGAEGAKNNSSSSTKNNTCVKVSMDGAIYLRKIDLSSQKGYSELASALEKLFGCYGGIGEGMKDIGENGGEYKLIYEDKDGDWMLVGDVPWEMFMESCKRLRIMKRSETSVDSSQSSERDFLNGAFSKEN